MKLILAIVNGDDSAAVSDGLIKKGFSVTKLATTGGFLKKGNSTFVIGVANEKVEEAVDIIRENSSERIQKVPNDLIYNMELGVPFSSNFVASNLSNVKVGGATLFILDVEQFLKL